jgi:predicted Zn-dependent peptidase
MNFKCQIAFAVILSAMFGSSAFGQASSQPRQERLLNGLNVLIWQNSGASSVDVRIRVHSGASFDPQGKEGVMKLLAENIFPTEVTRDFFRDDLGGSVDVLTTYDYIQISASAKPEHFLQMIETLAAAVANPTIDKDTTAKLKAALTEKVIQLESQPDYQAERAAAKQLLGTFPYGRPAFGTPSSIGKVDFADLVFAKQRFFTADNATITVSGNFDRSAALRAIRRFFGAWLKSDKRVPSTFKQPDTPAVTFTTVPSPNPAASVLRLATRSPARKDKNYVASLVLASVLEKRLRSHLDGNSSDAFVRVEAHTLPGVIFFGLPSPSYPTKGTVAAGQIESALNDSVTDAEFASARAAIAGDWDKREIASFWLDADTYGLQSVDQDIRSADAVKLADVNAYREILKRSPIVAALAAAKPNGN